MALFARNWEEVDRRLRAVVEPELVQGETVVGVVHANQAKTFSAELFAVGVTPERLVIVPLDKKMAASGQAESVTRCAMSARRRSGDGAGERRSSSRPGAATRSASRRPQRTYKLMVLGGTMFEDALAGEGQLAGLESLIALPAVRAALTRPSRATRRRSSPPRADGHADVTITRPRIP